MPLFALFGGADVFKVIAKIAQAAWNSIGYTTGACLGAGFADRRRPVVFTGDGGFQMVCQAMSDVVVVFPWVPVTTTECFPRMKSS